MAILASVNTIFLKLIGFLLSTVLVWSVPPQSGTTIEAANQAGLKLQVSIISDAHMQSFDYPTYQELAKALRDVGVSKAKQDALVFVGDNTMNGKPFEYIMFYGILSHYNKVSPKNTLVAMGNHDLSLKNYDAADSIARHNFFLRSYNGMANDKTYYSQKINGYTFVLLGGEGPGDTTITQAQVDWLSRTMAAADRGKPVFVFVHQPINTASVLAVLEQYPNVLLFNGHLHTPLNIRSVNGITRINLEGLHSHKDRALAGEGLQMEVYADKVLLRGRNYMNGKWLSNAEYEIPLV